MALDIEINEEKFNGLSDGMKAEYKKTDSGSYRLDVSGLPDTGALERAHLRQKEVNTTLQAQLEEANAKLSAVERAKLVQSGDIATLEKQWAEKSAKEKKELLDKLAARDQLTANAERDRIATTLVSKLTDHPAILMPHVKARLSPEVNPDTGAVTIRVLGADGGVSAMTVDELAKEFTTDKTFSSIIRVSKASGANGSGVNGSGANGSRQLNNGQGEENLANVSAASLVDRINAKKAAQG